MNAIVKTYEEFLEGHKEYDGSITCFAGGCNEPAYYEGGDYRWYCGVCEKHAKVKDRYAHYLYDILDKTHARLLWDRDNGAIKDIRKTAEHFLLKLIKEDNNADTRSEIQAKDIYKRRG